jgi:diketogulonate reductase-like aldo/keto reductase
MQADASSIVSTYGVRVPGIIYGTAWKQEQTAELVRKAIGFGFRGIDTACQPKHYNEAGVGAGIAASLDAELNRSDLYVQTKFTTVSGQDPQRIPYDSTARLSEQVAQSFAASLRNLQTDYLDCLVLHSPIPDIRQANEVWQAMEALFDSGIVKQLGISNCYNADYLAHLYQTARIKPAVVQNRFYAETGYDRDIRAFCKQHGILYQSFWTLSANPQLLASKIVTSLALQYSRTPAQILFRYLTHEGIVPLTGTKSDQHMRDDLAIFEFELTLSECAATAAILV